MKKIFLTVIVMMAALFVLSCDDKKTSTTDDDTGNTTDSAVDDDNVDTADNPAVDDDTADTGEDTCRLDSAFLEAKYDQYVTIRQTGKIFDYDAVNADGSDIDPSAVASESKIKLDDVSMEGTWGSYMNYQGTTLLAQIQAYDFVKTDEAKSATRIQLLTAMAQLNLQLIPAMIGDGIKEVDFGAYTFLQEVYIDAKFDAGTGQITEQNVRRMCMAAVSKTEEVEEEGETYDVAIGGIYACLEDDQVGAVGETLKMMFNLEMTTDEDAVIAFQNTRSDGTIAKPEDDDYTEQCTCYSLYEKDASGDPA
ncbi:hypothetical protein KAH37_01340, partial [bacterium]|nr:hypothetical protein [bacterium]